MFGFGCGECYYVCVYGVCKFDIYVVEIVDIDYVDFFVRVGILVV